MANYSSNRNNARYENEDDHRSTRSGGNRGSSSRSGSSSQARGWHGDPAGHAEIGCHSYDNMSSRSGSSSSTAKGSRISPASNGSSSRSQRKAS